MDLLRGVYTRARIEIAKCRASSIKLLWTVSGFDSGMPNYPHATFGLHKGLLLTSPRCENPLASENKRTAKYPGSFLKELFEGLEAV